ncbi:MAG: GntR family transcriptional regulator [Nitriliruptorales bacterium]
MSPVPFIDRPDSLAQRAYKAVRQAIKDGDLAGDQLYSENELAGSMGISRTPVREALIELSREGLVEIVPQRGFRLRSLTEEEEHEVFALRIVLEGFVAERLASKANAADVAELRAVLDRQRDAFDDPDTFLSHDETFHLLMPRLVGLERTHQMMVTLRGALWLMGSSALAYPARASEAYAEHEAVVDAIAAGDVDRAVQAAEAHVSRTAEAFRRFRERLVGAAPHADSDAVS